MVSPAVLDEVLDQPSERPEDSSPFDAPRADLAPDRYGARFSYETLLLLQPQIPTSGLYSLGDEFYVVCPSADSAVADDGRPITEWFEAHRQLTAPVRLVERPPSGARRVGERSLNEVVDLVGEPLTGRDVETMMTQWLGREFPFLALVCDPREATTIRVSRVLNDGEQALLKKDYDRLRWPMPLRVEVQPETKELSRKVSSRPHAHDLHLATSRLLPSTTSRALRHRVEDDEDFWATARRLLWSEQASEIQALPEAFSAKKGSRCLVDSGVCPAANVRSFLCLHNPVTFVLPLAHQTEAFLNSLQITTDELVRLCQMQRVQFIVPQSVNRYDENFLAQLCELAPDSILFSRRLATEVVVKAREHAPLLYPIASVVERRQALMAFHDLGRSEKNPFVRSLLDALFRQLKRSWSETEYRLHFQGAMGPGFLGLAPVLADLLEKWKGLELYVEASSAGFAVEWSNALGATLYPFHTDGYSAQRISEACASMYYGIPVADPPSVISKLEPILSGLVAPANDADVFELCRIFDGESMKEFRSTIQAIADGTTGKEDLTNEIKEFTRKVRQYETKIERLRWLDITAPAVLLAPEGWTQCVSLAAFVGAKFVTADSARLRGWPARLHDQLVATLTRTPSEVVFVSRVGRTLV